MGCADSSMAKTPLRGADGAATSNEEDEQAQNSLSITNKLHDGIALKFKRHNVFTAGVDVDEKVPNIKNIPKTVAQRNLILQALEQNFIFATLGDEEKDILVNAMELMEVNGNFNVITQGEEGDFFYVIEKGVFTVIVNDEAVASIGDGKSFGELALLYNMPRQATIRSQGVAQLFSLDRATFRYTLAKTSADRISNVQGALSKVPLLSGLTQLQLHKISQAVDIQKFEPGFPASSLFDFLSFTSSSGQTIIEKGSEGNIFYMIHEGTVSVTDVGSSGAFNDHTLCAGSYFGERALITGEPRAANVIATTPTTVMALDRESFTSLLGPLREVLDHNLNMRVLENIKLFSNLTERERSKVSRSFEFETFAAGTHIIREGEKGKKFFILKEGSALVKVGEETVSTLQGGQYFGEMALLDDEVRKASVIADADCECFVLDRSTFTRILGSLQSIIARETEQRKNELQQKTGGGNQSIEEPIAFNDLNRLAILGAGTFGRVSLVQHRSTGAVYALKAMSKAHIVQNKQQRNVMQEKALMVQFNHPFVLRLYQTYQDSTYLYMLLEFIQGGELFSVIHTTRSDGISVAATKFYSCCIFLGLAYLHSKDISYRDMKPENCLIDSKGYPKLVDFGFSKVITSKSYTLCGTPEYLAPEIVLGRGHDKSVDYWALGILVYEMIAGYSPFADHQSMDQVVICRNIVNGKLVFPRGFDIEGRDLIRQLLTRDPIARLGNLRGGTDDIKSHSFYASLDHNALLAGSVAAPWVPTAKSLTDTSNFDPVDETEPDYGTYSDKSGWDRDF